MSGRRGRVKERERTGVMKRGPRESNWGEVEKTPPQKRDGAALHAIRLF